MKDVKAWLAWLWHFPRRVLAGIVSIYQRTLSPDHGMMKGFFPYGFCKFEPSCSQYMKERLLADGVVVGLIKGSWQIVRCNPWNKGNRMK